MTYGDCAFWCHGRIDSPVADEKGRDVHPKIFLTIPPRREEYVRVGALFKSDRLLHPGLVDANPGTAGLSLSGRTGKGTARYAERMCGESIRGIEESEI